MKRNLFVISESEKERILGMHRAATQKQYLSEADVVVPAKPADVLAFQQWVVNTKGDKTILGKGGRSGFGDDGVIGPNTISAWTKYGKEFTETGGKPTAQPTTPDSYTVYKQDPTDPNKTVPTKMTKDEITKGLADGTLKKDVKVWDPSLGNTPVPMTTLTADTTIQNAIKSIAPELQKELSLYILDANNQRQGPLNATELEKRIVTDKTITSETKVYNGSTWVPASQIADLKPFFDKLGPQAPTTPKEDFVSTNVPELDAWLKTPVGMAWDKMEEGDLKEKSLDTYTKSDPQLKAVADKIGVGKMRDALGTQRSTMLGRMRANRQQKRREKLGPGPVQR
jgi:hypothetical protein